MFRLSAQGGVREPIFKNGYELLFMPPVKYMLGYSVRNGKFKQLEPHFQISATRSGWKEVTETAVASPHSRACTKEPISPLCNIGLMEKFGSRAERRNILQEKLRGRGGSSCRFEHRFGKKKKKCEHCNTGEDPSFQTIAYYVDLFAYCRTTAVLLW